MKLDFGENIARPTLGVTVSPAEQQRLWDDDEAVGAYRQLTQAKELTESLEAKGATRLHFKLRAIARRPEATHEERLGKIVRLLGGVAGYNHHPSDDQELRALSFGSIGATDVNGSASLAVELALPPVEDGRLSRFTTRVMQGMARQLRYEQRIGRRKGGYTDFVFSAIDRQGASEGGGVLLETNPTTKAHLWLENVDLSSPDRLVVSLAAYNLSSHKQQLICLAGIAALTHAEQPVAKP